MKKYLSIIVTLVLLAGCSDILQKPVSPKEDGSFGTVRIKMAGTARTLLPKQFSFDLSSMHFVLTFTKEGGGEQITETMDGQDSLAVLLNPGLWDFDLRGYASAEDVSDPLSALVYFVKNGINVLSGSATTIDVTPRPNDENLTQAGSGTLSYRFIFPEGAAATLKLYTLDGEETGETIDLAETETACEGILVLDSGFYYAGVVVEHEGKMAVWRELAHIYDGAVTEAVYEFSVNDFIYSAAGAITQFSFSLAYEYVYPIDQDAKTISVIVPPGTDLSALKANIIYTGAMLTPGQGEAADFSGPVTYTVHTGDIEESYTVTVTERSLSNIGELTDYLNYCAGIESDEPVPVKYNVSLNQSAWLALLNAIALAEDKLIDLDLSPCTPGNDTGGLRSDGTFDTMWNIETGKAKIRKFILPDAATVILDGYIDGGNYYNNYTVVNYVAFKYFTELNIVKGRNVTYIGDLAFIGLSLEEVDFPEAITICFAAFESSNLSKIIFPKVVTIGEMAFFRINALTEVNFPEAIVIGYEAFHNCINLEYANFPKAETIGIDAFSVCPALATVNIPEAVTIESSAFFGTALTSVYIPKAVTIGGAAFSDCPNLQSISFPASVDLVSIMHFTQSSSLTSFILIGEGALSVRENGRALIRNNTELVAFPSAYGSITIGDISVIDPWVFYGCTGLVEVNFPEVITIGDNAFSGCTALVDANFPEAVTVGGTFSNCYALKNLNLPKAQIIGSTAFIRCASLTNLYIPSVKEFGDSVLQNTGTQALTITMGSEAPILGSSSFNYWSYYDPPEYDTAGKNVTVYVPDPAAYDTAWQDKFKEDSEIVLTVEAIE